MVIISLFHHICYLLNTYKHFDLDLPIGKIRLMHNNTHASTRLLCVHGWLDNRASFLPMMPYMQAVECVAVDLAGHGQSAHRDRNSLYHYIDNVRDIKLIMGALQWEQCHLVGHSMGGSISLMAATAIPERVLSVTMIDSLHPLARKPEDGPALLRRSLQQFSRWDLTRQKTFSTLDEAVSARLAASPYSQSEASARLVMKFATKRTEEGYRLRSDARLNFRSPVMLSRAQIDAFIQAVEQPVLAVLGTRGIVQNRQDINYTLSLFRNINAEYLEGGHHVHMEKPHETAKLCLGFLNDL
jgi:pimeloyl-ACP methyl ester carboxylesterase